MTRQLTTQQIAALGIVAAVGDALRELQRPIPSGEFYAHFMDKLTLNDYEACIATLRGLGWVQQSNFLLTWTGPDKSIFDAVQQYLLA